MDPNEREYILAGAKSWNRHVFEEKITNLPGKWSYVQSPDELSRIALRDINPRYVFFLHWSHRVPAEIIEHCECVCFHMTDVPYGRGGSPLQNLIVRGHTTTKMTALRMVESLDAGPVYLKRDLCLLGGAEEIYIRASILCAEMIAAIIEQEPTPVPQEGKVVTFTRRRPDQSEIGQAKSLVELHDFIRMLDAEGYPKAFLEHAGFRFEFRRAALYDGYVEATVRIRSVD